VGSSDTVGDFLVISIAATLGSALWLVIWMIV
jgi:hypothetical protein